MAAREIGTRETVTICFRLSFGGRDQLEAAVYHHQEAQGHKVNPLDLNLSDFIRHAIETGVEDYARQVGMTVEELVKNLWRVRAIADDGPPMGTIAE